MDDELKDYRLHVEYSENIDREPIDFEIRNSQGELFATVWGSEPWHDVQVDCSHDIVEYDDDETVGECVLCGDVCSWHWEDDGEGHRRQVPHEWNTTGKIGGIIGRELKRLQEKW